MYGSLVIGNSLQEDDSPLITRILSSRLFFLFGCLAAVPWAISCWVFHFQFPFPKVAEWGLVIFLAIISLYISFLISWIIGICFFQALRLESAIIQWQDLSQPITLALWSLVCILLFVADEDSRFLANKIFISLCVFCVAVAFKRIVLRFISSSFMDRAFKDQVEQANIQNEIIQILISKASKKAHPLGQQGEEADDLDEENTRCNFLTRCCYNGYSPVGTPSLRTTRTIAEIKIPIESSLPLTGSRRSKAAARRVFYCISSDRLVVTLGDIERFVGDSSTAKDVFSLFSGLNEVPIAKLDFRSRFVEIIREKENLDKSIHLSFQALHNLNNIFSVALFAAALLFSMSVFGMNFGSTIALSLSGMLTFGWMFGDTAKASLQCLIFLFVKHPFNVGDTVKFADSSTAQELQVVEMNIFTTVLQAFSGEQLIYPNEQLVNKPIINFSRQPLQFEVCTLTVPSSRLTVQKIKDLRSNLNDWLTQHPDQFFPTFELVAQAQEQLPKQEMRMVLKIKCKQTADGRRILDRKVLLSEFLATLGS